MGSTWSNASIIAARFGERKGYITQATMLGDANATFTQLAWPYDLTGQFIVSVSTKNGATGPTDNLNLILKEDNNASGYDLLLGSGNNAIKNNGSVTVRPGNNATYLPAPVFSPFGVAISGQNTANASTIITIRSVPQP